MFDTKIEVKPSHTLDSLSLMPNNIKFANQNPEEQVVLFIRQHKIILVGYFIKFIINVFIPIFLFFLIKWILTFSIFSNSNFEIKSPYDSVITCLIVFWYLWTFTKFFSDFLSWFYNAYIITSVRLLDLDFISILKHSIKELDLKNIEDAVDTHSGLLQTIFDMGTVTVSTASESTKFSLGNVPKSSKIRDFIMDISIYTAGRDRG